ncbi:MAG: helix-turn-helix transcriptional regulator [Blastocatellia bacterium]
MSHSDKMAERFAELPYLLAERPYTQKELMDHFKADRKTIKSSIDALTRRHRITEKKEGRHVYYYSVGGYKRPDFIPVELATLLLAQEAIGSTGLTAISSPFARHAESLLQKVRDALPPSLSEKLDAMAAVYGSATAPAKDFTPYAGTIDRLTNAAVERRRVLMRYHTLHSGEVKERKLDPYAVYFDPDGATIKVIGYDHEREKIITFSVDHIRRIRETGERFQRPPDWNLRDHLAKYCFNGIHDEPIKVRLRAHGVTASIFAERTFHRSQREIERDPPDSERPKSITIEMEVAKGRGLVRFILSWAPDVEALSPPELRREVAEAYRQALARCADVE